jgi:AraC-like DNA-binding protein
VRSYGRLEAPNRTDRPCSTRRRHRRRDAIMVVVSRQSYVERGPVPALAELVSTVWIQRVPASSSAYTQRNLPNGTVEIVCEIGAVPRIAGPRTAPAIDFLTPGTTLIGIRVQPGAAGSLLGVPARELLDLSVTGDEFWGSEGCALGERLAGAASPQAALELLQRHLARRLVVGPATDRIVTETVRQLRAKPTQALRAIRSSLHVSERHFRRRVQAAVGVPPKTLQCMLRFQRLLAVTQLASWRGIPPARQPLATLAASTGYADQSHLIRECRRFTGLTPSGFLNQVARDCGCGHDHRASFVRAFASGQSLVVAGTAPGHPL